MEEQLCKVHDTSLICDVVPGEHGMGEEIWFCPWCKIGELEAKIKSLREIAQAATNLNNEIVSLALSGIDKPFEPLHPTVETLLNQLLFLVQRQ